MSGSTVQLIMNSERAMRPQGRQEVRAVESPGAAGSGRDGPPRHVGVRTVPPTRHQADDALQVRRTAGPEGPRLLNRSAWTATPGGHRLSVGFRPLPQTTRTRGPFTKRKKSYAKENGGFWRCRVEVHPSLSSGKAAQRHRGHAVAGAQPGVDGRVHPGRPQADRRSPGDAGRIEARRRGVRLATWSDDRCGELGFRDRNSWRRTRAARAGPANPRLLNLKSSRLASGGARTQR